jgi:TPP-dependent pyruvate/acetoin dehydrogenase alpha subunit
VPVDAQHSAGTFEPRLARIYQRMVTMRRFEEAIASGCASGQIHGEMHLGIGQESAAAVLAVRGLPVLFLVEDNGYSISVPRARSTAGDLIDRARPLGMAAGSCDGRDIEQTDALLGSLLAAMRSQRAPAMAVVQVYRFRGHYEGDLDLYRPAGEREQAMSAADDPLQRARARLLATGVGEAQLLELEDIAAANVARWLAAALQRPGPDISSAREGVFAGA